MDELPNRKDIMRLRLGLVATAIAAVIAGTPIAAHADTNSHRDARRDAARWPEAGDPRPAPRNKASDITRVWVRYTRAVLITKMWARNVPPRRIGRRLVVNNIRTGGGRYVTILDTHPHGRIQQRLWRAGERVPCPEMSFAYRPAQDVIVMRVPASCIGHPAWVRLNEWQSWERRGLFTDRARSDVAEGAPSYSPRIHR